MLFTDLKLSEPLLKAISDQGYTTPSPVQAQAIPYILEGRDMLAGAQTGTGKTAGFTLPMLEILSRKTHNTKAPKQVRALILTPTRELAAQVGESVKLYGKYLKFKSAIIFGGVGMQPQVAALRQGVDIVIATPGRLLDHMSQGTIDLRHVEILILDEADRMLDMGFIKDIRRVISVLPQKRQNLLFSATYSDDIKSLCESILRNPAIVEVARRNTSSELVTQRVILVDCARKSALFGHLAVENNWKQVLVFTRTKHQANKLSDYLQKIGVSATAIHGNKSQAARTKALADFKAGSVRILVATDIAARGLDIDQLPHVVNLELPNIAEDYVHRIGRTGRAGNEGEAISLVCVDEYDYLKSIERLIGKKFDREVVVGFEPDPAIIAMPILQGRGFGHGNHSPSGKPQGQKRESGTRQQDGGRNHNSKGDTGRNGRSNKQRKEGNSKKY
jgi:ATP-dependent RNA helicase RhlE